MSKHHHHHHHHHQHHHSEHGHDHQGELSLQKQSGYNRTFALGISLNLFFVCIEFFLGIYSGSLALVADAGHNLSDVAGLALAWGAFWLAHKKPNQTYTFGLRKSSILSALLNSILLLIAVGIIFWEAIHRVLSPNTIQPNIVIVTATIGIIINSLTAMLFFKDKNHDLNIRGAFLHMAADALISLGVVVSALIIAKTSWYWIDPIVSILISLFIVYGTWDLLNNSIYLSMDAVPKEINYNEVKSFLSQLENVSEVHDLHIWPISTTETALTAHLTTTQALKSNDQLSIINHELQKRFNINHSTIQFELLDTNYRCHLQPDDVV